MYVLSAKLCFVPVGSHGKAPAHAPLSVNNTSVQVQKGVASNCYAAAQAEARFLIHTEQIVPRWCLEIGERVCTVRLW